MKNCNEMVDGLFERREQYHIEQKRKKKNLIRTVTSICCVCLVALLGFGAWQEGLSEKEPTQTAEDALYPGVKDCYGPGEEEFSSAPSNSENTADNDMTAKRLFAINEITKATNAAPLYRDPALHYNEVWDLDKTVDYLGVNILQSVSALPKGLSLQYTENNEFIVVFENNGTLVEDRICYNFSGNNGAKLTVLASKLRNPYDCVYASDTDEVTNIRIPETDEIIPLLVYAQRRSESALEYHFYVIDFEYGGNYYRITAENIHPRNLDSLVRSIVK